MKSLKILGLAAVAAMALTAFAAGNASATTLEVGGEIQTSALTITLSLEQGTTLTTSRTDGSFANTCTGSHAHGTLETKQGAGGPWEVTGPLTGHSDGRPPESGLSFSGCTRPTTVHDPGTLEVVHIPGTTDGTVFSENAQWTTGSPFGTLNCKTGETTHIGTLTGVDGSPTNHATLDINAVLNCGFLVPSARWEGSYTVTTPTNLGVQA
ncbi:MAG TPA: hypothetical protein VFZ29_11055 [Solirubrobacterales bacterium]